MKTTQSKSPTPPSDLGDAVNLTPGEYEMIRRLVYSQSGINLGPNKSQLVRARLGKLVRRGGFQSFGEYCHSVESRADGQELCELLDAITTNTTHLFREIHHFDFLKDKITEWASNKSWKSSNSTLRIWSAACSTGEEPHSIAMVADEVLSRFNGVELKILATDLSTKVLARAKRGLYESHRVGTVPAPLRARCFDQVEVDGKQMLQLSPRLRKAITFSRFNLMSPTFPFRHGFHIIFCRNVMIYFDRQTQEGLVNRMAKHLLPGGYLMIGHSESLNGVQHPLSYVEPTVYQK